MHAPCNVQTPKTIMGQVNKLYNIISYGSISEVVISIRHRGGGALNAGGSVHVWGATGFP